METIIEAINELRQKLINQTISDTNIAILHRLEGYLHEAQYNMRLAKRTVDEHKIEL